MRLMVGATANAVREKILTELAQIARARGRAYLLVPEQFTMQTDRALLERLDVPVMMDIKVKSFGSLSREVLGRVGGAKLAYVNESGRRMLAQYLLGASREGLTILGKSWDKRGAAAKLVETLGEFRSLGMDALAVAKLGAGADVPPLLAAKLADVEKLLELMREQQFGKLVAHAPYTMNLCAAKEDIRKFSKEMIADDLRRMEYMPGNYYNFHPGSHVGQGADAGIEWIAEALNEVLTPEQTTTVLLETMAGKGSEVGRSFEELRAIIDRVELSDKLGICLDTCHVWDAGYDIAGDLDGVLEEFDHVIGLNRLCAVHFNDSMNDRGSHKDRHACIGEGKIGLDAMRRVATHPLLSDKPFILETPNDDEGYRREIALFREWRE